MSGFDNSVLFITKSSEGEQARFYYSSDLTEHFDLYNSDGSPEGSIAADKGSMCCDTTNGTLYIKTTDTVNTGWQQLQSGGAVATSYVTDSGTAVASSNILNVVGGSGVSTSGSGSTLTVNSVGGGVTWNVISDTSENMVVNNGYVSNNAGTVTLTLPVAASVGDTLRVSGLGAGGWLIAQNAGQLINFGNSTTTTGAGGSLASTQSKDCVELVCVVSNTTFNVLSSIGNITVV